MTGGARVQPERQTVDYFFFFVIEHQSLRASGNMFSFDPLRNTASRGVEARLSWGQLFSKTSPSLQPLRPAVHKHVSPVRCEHYLIHGDDGDRGKSIEKGCCPLMHQAGLCLFHLCCIPYQRETKSTPPPSLGPQVRRIW